MGRRARRDRGSDRDYVVGIRRVCREVVYPHVFGSSDREVGGVLVGWSGPGGRMPVVTAAIPAISADEQRATLTFTQDSWEHIHRVMDADFPKDQIVGWYHSHPGFGIFLSDHDMFIQENFFNGPSQIALVVDPLAGSEGVFAWRDGKVVQCIDRGTPEPFAGQDPQRRIDGLSSVADPESEMRPRRPGEFPLVTACVLAATAGLAGLAIGFGAFALFHDGGTNTPTSPVATERERQAAKPEHEEGARQGQEQEREREQGQEREQDPAETPPPPGSSDREPTPGPGEESDRPRVTELKGSYVN